MAFYWWQRGNGTWVYYDDTWGHHIEVDPDGTQRERKGPPPEHDMPDSGLRPPGVVPVKLLLVMASLDGLPLRLETIRTIGPTLIDGLSLLQHLAAMMVLAIDLLGLPVFWVPLG
ncbi:MAG: hypothetical protein ACLQPD_02430 [Desulfomonilaceae bacterium]